MKKTMLVLALWSGLSAANSLDIDGDGTYQALTDGVLIMRYMSGERGTNLINGAVSSNCTRCTATEIENYIASMMP